MALFGSDNFRPRTTAEIFGTTVDHEEDPLPTNVAALPADVAALQSIINTLQAELKATTSINTHLAASVARLQAEQSNHTSTDTALNTPTTTTTAPLPFPHPGNTGATIACGRGAASPEVFQQIIKSNWHGRLGRTHMVDVDALPPAALMELDSLLRRKLQCIFPHGAVCTHVDADNIFACLAVLGLRMEDRARYVDNRILGDDTICHDSTTKRARLLSAHFHANLTMQNYGYWRGLALETLVELARYRGLFDDEGYLKVE